MDSIVMERRVVLRTGRERVRHQASRQAGWVAFAAAVFILLALLPVYAGSAGSMPASAPGPLPAPAPSYPGPDYSGLAQP